MILSRFDLGEKPISMISVVEGNEYLKPYTFNDDYLPLSNDQFIVDAFAAFLDWTISFIQDIVDMVFGPIVEAISNLVDSYCSGVRAAPDRAEMDVVATGNVSSSSLSMLSEALNGELFWVLMGLGALIQIVLTLLAPITISLGFLVGMALSAIVAVIVHEALMVDSDEEYGGGIPSENTAESVVGCMIESGAIDGNPTTEQVAWSAFGGAMGIFSEFIGAGGLVIAGAKAFQASVFLSVGAISILLG
jgi:hypothetical protein